MRIEILTLFPEMLRGPLDASLLKKAQDKGILTVNLVDLRDFTSDKHKTADDSPYGGGPGMVMKVDVISSAINSLKEKVEHGTPNSQLRTPNSTPKVIFLCPTGQTLTQAKVKELAKAEHLVLLCGHYEGVDERVRGLVDEEISIGDYVLTGGELPALVLVDAVARYLPGVVKEEESVQRDSFHDGLLDYPSYTKPEDFSGEKVPEALTSGHHKQIERWRRKETLRLTLFRRPDLLAKAELSDQDRLMLAEIVQGN